MRRGRRTPAALVALLLAFACLPAAARAHAVLERSDPVNDIVLKAAPSEITLTFSEKVEPIGSLQLFDDNAKQLTMGKQVAIAPNVTRARIESPLTPGTYTVVWRALSSDGHAVNGAFVFHVVKRGANPNGVIGTIGSGRPSLPLRTASGIARFLDLAFIVLIVGGVAALLTVLSRQAGAAEARLWYLVSALAFSLSVAAAATIVLQGAEVRGITIGGATQGGVIGDVVSTQFGKVRLAQLLIAEVVAVVAVWAASSHRGAGLAGTLGLSALALTVTPALSGHAGSIDALAIVVDVVHVVAVSLWVGGLAFVAVALLLAKQDRGRLARDVLPRFSRLALVCVGAVLLSGAINGLRQLDGLTSLWQSRYGVYLMIKIGLALALIGFGALNRRLLTRLTAGRDDTALKPLRRQISWELATMLAVLVVTTLLVAEPPARTIAAGPLSASTTVGDLAVRVVVDPARVGPNLIHVYVSRDGKSVDPDEVRVSATQAAAKLGPISAPTERNEPGHYVATSVPLSAAGEWTIRVTTRSGEFDATEATVRVKVRSPLPK